MSYEAEEDQFDGPEETRWTILVEENSGRWIITRVSKGVEVGEYEIDLCKKGEDWKVGAIFDSSVTVLLEAITKIGGSSIEVSENIEGLLSGVCRSFVESQANLKRWRSAVDPAPAQDA